MCELADLKPLSQAKVIQWIERMVELYRANGSVSSAILHAAAVEDDFHRHAMDLQDLAIKTLAAVVPGFKKTQGVSKQAKQSRIRAKLMLAQLDQVCYGLAMRHTLDAEREAYLSVMAQQIIAFLRPTHAKKT
ncbi:MAG: hypothetical protein NTX56_05530 [Proteobacteria bacterium]|nr:hypothetical protein [Pseudomonadota bacterium]